MTLRYSPLGITIIIIAFEFPEFKGDEQCSQTNPTLIIKDGTLTGKIMFSQKGKSFCAFLGIPYAQPPIGEFRFKPPQPVRPWNGTLNATKDSDDCVQPSIPFLTMTGSEDCLYLNVYTPQLKSPEVPLMSVMVWICGGGFLLSSGSSYYYEPHFLMDKDVVLVSISYRVGAFGFLSTGDDECPGNFGMKDQVAALQWIQQNIEHFGGNPKSVTLFGQSAGAASVHYHMLSPLTNGLFHNAISMEGTALVPWARDYDPLSVARKQASSVGCPTNSTYELIACLREVSTESIHEAMFMSAALSLVSSLGFSPVVENKTERNPEPYLPADPLHIITSGEFKKVPWLMGNNENPSGYFLAPVLSIDSVRNQFNEEFSHAWLDIFQPTGLNFTQKQSLWLRIAQFYNCTPDYIHKGEEINYMNVLSDYYMIHGIYKAALYHGLAGHKSIYKYNFVYRGVFSGTVFTSLENFGVVHGDELRYIFKNYPYNFTLLPYSENDMQVAELMLTLWTNFAKFGNPTPKSVESTNNISLLNNFVWEPIGDICNNEKHIRYLNIGQVATPNSDHLHLHENLGPVKLNMSVDLYKERMEFWDSVPLYENTGSSACKEDNNASWRSTFNVQISVLCILVCIISSKIIFI